MPARGFLMLGSGDIVSGWMIDCSVAQGCSLPRRVLGEFDDALPALSVQCRLLVEDACGAVALSADVVSRRRMS